MPTKKKTSILTNQEIKMMAFQTLRSLIPGQFGEDNCLSIEDYGLQYYGIPVYPKEPSVLNYKLLYKKNGLAKRIVNIYPSGCWQEFPTVREGVNAKKSDFEKAWETLVANLDLNLPYNLLKVDKLSGIGQFGVLYLGFDDSADTTKPVTKVKELRYIRAFSEASVTIQSIETNASSPRYGKPLLYEIKLQDLKTQTTTFQKPIHWSRILHVVEDTEESEIYGSPRLEGIVPQILNVSLLLHGSTHIFIRGGFPGIAYEVDPDIEFTPEDKAAFKAEIEQYIHSVSRYTALQGIKANSLSVNIASPAPYIKAQMEFIAATTGIPSRMLAGSEQAQLASQQDRENFNDRIRARQKNYVTPGIVLPFIKKLQDVGVLPQNKEPLSVEWKQTDLSSRKEKAEISQLRADALNKYSSSPFAQQIMPSEKFFEYILECTPEEVKSIVDAIDEGDLKDLPIEEDSNGELQ
jgi:hypothetical protein